MRDQMANFLSLFVNTIPKSLIPKIFGDIAPIFMLHRLVDSDEEHQEKNIKHIEWCLQYIRKYHYNPISVHDLALAYTNKAPIKPRSVAFTFDDGFYDQYTLALPLFNKYDIPYTCFLITGFLDKKLWPWDDQIRYVIDNTTKDSINTFLPGGKEIKLKLITTKDKSYAIKKLHKDIKLSPQDSLYEWLKTFYSDCSVQIPENIPDVYQPMDWQQAQELINQGHDIAPHTVSHRILSQLSDEQAKQEIEGSLKRINEKLTHAKSVFAYPTGRTQDYTQREIKFLQQIGMTGSVSTVPEHSTPTHNIHELPRYSLPNTKFDFVQYLSFFEKLKP